MPPKKSKKKQPATKAVEDALLLDIFSYLDKIQECLDIASISPSSCLDGIAKADEALRQSQGDSGIQCTILMKRAQLLFIAVENKYDTRGLPEWHKNALESCILDCEQVLSGLSSTDPITRDIYQAAHELNSKAKAMAKTRVGTGMKNPTSQVAGVERRRPPRFDPERTVFKNISKINPYLLQDVVDCYRKAKIVCKFCFFRNRRQEKVGVNRYCRQCKRTSPSVLVIPSSKLCLNFANMTFLPILPPPKVLLANGNRHKPFQYCHNHDHKLCFEKSATGDSWFAHSIEELVIWTVQRHYGCSFSQYIKSHHEDISIPPFNAVSSVLRSGELDDFDSSLSGSNAGTDDDSGYEFYPDEVNIDCVASIPQHLLKDVIDCYDKVKEYCKWCFYKRCKMGAVSFDSTSSRMICSICSNEWESVLVIPASDYCWNFGDFEYIPIAPWPRGKRNRDPFEYCAKEDHFRCFKVYIDTEFWYSHSVEEQVIWTVEREHGCTFSDYVKKLKKRLPPELSPKPLPPPHPPASVTRNLSSSKLGPMSNAIPITPTSTSNPSTKSPYDPSPHAPRIPTFSSILASPPRSSRPNFRVSTDGFLGAPSTNAENPSISGWNKLVSTGNPPVSAASSSNRAGNSLTRPVNPPVFAVNSSMSITSRSVNATGPPTSWVNAPISSVNPSISSVNPSISSVNPPISLVNPPISSVNPPISLVNPPISSVNPPISSVNPPISSVNPPISLVSHPISSANPPISVVNPPFSAVNPPIRAANPSIDAMNSTMSHWITAGGPSISAGYLPAVAGSLSTVAGSLSTSAGFPPVGASVPSITIAEASPESAKEEEPQVYKLSEISFKALAEIPRHLLESIARCFCQKVEVCRKCFYGDRSLSSWVQGENMCSLSLHKWMNPIFVIPGCDLCDNEPCFKKGEYVPIPPLPPLAIIKKCSNANHHKCFLKSLESNEWFAHSVEELVVWVVESEKECTFDEYIIHELQIQDSEPVWDPPNPQVSQRISELPVMANPNVAVASAGALPQMETATTVTPLMDRRPETGKLFDPEKTIFNSISDIPNELLVEVAQCFQKRMLICRICYFESHCRELSSKKTTRNTCEKGHSWRHVRVIPRCSLCISPSTFISILPLPKHMKHCNSPFQVCKKTDHQTCFFMSKNTNPWFPHTVEELVIWTVERERGCSFEQVYESFLPKGTLKPQPVSGAYSMAENGSSNPQTSTGRNTKTSIAPNLNHPSIDTLDTLDLTKPEDREPSKKYYPGGKSGGEFAMNLHTSGLGFEEAVFLTSSKGDAKMLNMARPPPPLTHNQTNPDSLYSNFANYSMVPKLPPSPLEATQPVDLMGLPLSGSVGDSQTSPFSVMPMEAPQGGLTADDALEYFPALLGNRSTAVQNDFQREEDDMLLLGSGGRVIESQNEVGGVAAISSSMNFLDPLSFNTTDSLLASSSIMSSAHSQNQTFQTRGEPLHNGGPVVSSEEPISKPFIPVPAFPGHSNPSPENWPEIAHSQGFTSKSSTSAVVANSLQPAPSPVEDHGLLRMPTSQPLVLGKAYQLDELTKHEATVPVASVDEGTTTFASASESAATFVSISKSEGAITSISKSVPYEDGEASEAYQCLLCYVSFESAEQLVEHCKSAKHSLSMLMDSGNVFIWKHLPPPSEKVPEEFGMCANPDQCRGGLACQRPHFADEFSEWKLRYQHRNSRKQTPVNTLSLQLPTFAEQEVGLLLNECQEKSQYQAVKLSLSAPVQVTTSCEDSSFSWKIVLKGEDWQSLHGISCQTLTPSVFRIMRIEGDTFFTIQPKSLSWEAHSVNHTILLGRITVTIKATPASVGSYSCQVRLNLGFQQFLFFHLELTVRGLMESMSSPELETGLLPHLLAQPAPELMATSVHQEEQQVQLQIEPDESQVEVKLSEMVDGNKWKEQEKLEREPEELEGKEELGERKKQISEDNEIEEQWKAEKQIEHTNEPQREEQAGELGFQGLHFKDVPNEEGASPLPLPAERQQPHIGWQLSSSSSDELGIPNIEGEDLTLIHVPIEDLGFSLTGESGALLSDSLDIDDCS